jgi:hypothetical protein
VEEMKEESAIGFDCKSRSRYYVLYDITIILTEKEYEKSRIRWHLGRCPRFARQFLSPPLLWLRSFGHSFLDWEL